MHYSTSLALSVVLSTLTCGVAPPSGGGTSPNPVPNPNPTPRPLPVPTVQPTYPEPTPYPSPAPTTTHCQTIINTDMANLLVEGYTSMEDAYDKSAYGHAEYACALRLVETEAQYDKAEPYLWCVLAHCDNCTATAAPGLCPTSGSNLHAVSECKSATYNLLGFSSRKKNNPDFHRAHEYYKEAIGLWPANCGALGYLTELYLQTGNTTKAQQTYESLCATCGVHDSATQYITSLQCPTEPPTLASMTDAAARTKAGVLAVVAAAAAAAGL